VRGDDDAAAVGELRGEPSCHLDAVGPGQLQVEQRHVGPDLQGSGLGFVTGCRAADDLEVVHEVEQPDDRVADEVLVVGDEDAGHTSSS
jgi:hypothetical protein